MRKIIRDQLDKVTQADLSNLSEDHPFIVPQRKELIVEMNKQCVVTMSDDLLVRGMNPILESNYNKGTLPPTKYMLGEFERPLGKLVYFTGVGYDPETKSLLRMMWRGYLPKEKIKIEYE